MQPSDKRSVYSGIALAILAAIIWSGNFIAARAVVKQVPPVTLAFYRWLVAVIILFPFVIRKTITEWPVIRVSRHYLFWTALTGIAVFNTFIYIGAHHTTAINLALIGTTTSPVIAVILARIFLKEQIGWMKLAGLIFCISGVLLLISRGTLQNLVHFRFTAGDGWILAAATSFAIYNTLVKRKPHGISPMIFLFVLFCLGMLLLFPFYLREYFQLPAVHWNLNAFGVILYLGLGASVISFLCWNAAIGKLGAGRTILFGNLIPVFSSIEAALILHESFEWYHVLGMIIVFIGILVANLKRSG